MPTILQVLISCSTLGIPAGRFSEPVFGRSLFHFLFILIKLVSIDVTDIYMSKHKHNLVYNIWFFVIHLCLPIYSNTTKAIAWWHMLLLNQNFRSSFQLVKHCTEFWAIVNKQKIWVEILHMVQINVCLNID